MQRKKSGFLVPFESWLADAWQPLLREYLTPQLAADTEAFRWDELRAMLDAQRTGQRDFAYPLFTLLMFSLWWRMWITQELAVSDRHRSCRQHRVKSSTGHPAQSADHETNSATAVVVVDCASRAARRGTVGSRRLVPVIHPDTATYEHVDWSSTAAVWSGIRTPGLPAVPGHWRQCGADHGAVPFLQLVVLILGTWALYFGLRASGYRELDRFGVCQHLLLP